LVLSLFSPGVFLFSLTPPPTTEIYTLSLHDALPIWAVVEFVAAVIRNIPLLKDRMHRKLGDAVHGAENRRNAPDLAAVVQDAFQDRKSTRLNSSHVSISYAVFCLKKKKTNQITLAFRVMNSGRYGRDSDSEEKGTLIHSSSALVLCSYYEHFSASECKMRCSASLA